MTRYRHILFILGLLLAICSMQVYADRPKPQTTEVRAKNTGGRRRPGVQDNRIVKSGGHIKGPKVLWRDNRNRGNGLMGSGGMAYRYDNRTGLYNDLRSMKKNLYGFYADGSYSGMHNNVPMAATFLPGGYSTSLGFCYEYDYYGWFMIQTGIGLRWQSVGNNVDKVITEKDGVYDSQGYRYKLVYDFYDRCDYSDILYAQLPIFVGSYIGPFYYMVGLKLQLPLWGQTRVKVKGSTVGIYEQYIGLGPGDIFQEMDNHGLRMDVPEERKGAGIAGTYSNEFSKKKWDLLVSAELGWEWAVRDSRMNTGFNKETIYDRRIRLAIFADYGLLNQNQHTSWPLYNIPENYKWDFPMYEFNHVFSTEQTAQNKAIHNFYVGLKFTVLFGFPYGKPCIICGPFQSEREYQ